MWIRKLSKRFIIIQSINLIIVLIFVVLVLRNVTDDYIGMTLSIINFVASFIILSYFDYKDKKRPLELRLLSEMIVYYNKVVETYQSNAILRIRRENVYGRKETQPDFDKELAKDINRDDLINYFMPKFKETYGSKKGESILIKLKNNPENLVGYLENKITSLKITQEENQTFKIEQIKKYPPHHHLFRVPRVPHGRGFKKREAKILKI